MPDSHGCEQLPSLDLTGRNVIQERAAGERFSRRVETPSCRSAVCIQAPNMRMMCASDGLGMALLKPNARELLIRWMFRIGFALVAILSICLALSC